ncbi:MAG: protein kinase [Polyangiaceae bacterium]
MATTVRLGPGGGDGEGKGGLSPRGSSDPASAGPPTPRAPVVAAARDARAAGDREAHDAEVNDAETRDPEQRDSITRDGFSSPQVMPAGGRPQCPECGERFSRGSRFCAFDGARLADGPEEEPSDPLVGQTLGGKYAVLRSIGEGGMGTVYEVRHTALDRRFALKILRPEIAQHGEHLQRFLQEAKVAAAIGHPNIVSVVDFGEHDIRGRSVPFIVMEMLRGASLASILKVEKTLQPRRAARILAACAEALAAAHEAGVIHRDLKPDNIFVARESSERVKVLDFGVAKMIGAARLTKVGMVFGTPHYMSPEQAKGEPIDHRADIYALGVILYECLAGHVPFEADTSMGVLTKQIFANPEPIERVMPDARQLGALGAIVNRCLAKEPADRYSSMDQLADALRQALRDPAKAAASSLGGTGRTHRPALKLREEASLPRAESRAEEPAPSGWKRGVLFALAALAVLLLLAVSWRAYRRSTTPPVASPQAASAEVAADPAPTASAAPLPAVVPSAAPREPETPPGSEVVTGAASSVASGAPAAPKATASAGRTAPSSTTPARTTDVIDPWSRPAPRQPAGTGVVDPWAKKK